MVNDNSQSVLFYSIFVACNIQIHPQFYQIASDFFDTRNAVQFEQKYPFLNKTRIDSSKGCSGCPASTKYNEGMGIDCWFDVPLPLGEDVYGYIYNVLENRLRPAMRDLSKQQEMDQALGELKISEQAIKGGIRNKWLVDSPLLQKTVELTTQHNEFHVSVASIIGYLVRDGAMLIRTDLLSQIFSLNYMRGIPQESPLYRFSAAFMYAASIKKPVRAQIAKF